MSASSADKHHSTSFSSCPHAVVSCISVSPHFLHWIAFEKSPDCENSVSPPSRTRHLVSSTDSSFQGCVAHHAHELLNLLFCQRFRHQVGRVHIRTNFLDLDASCIHRLCMSTCFALPRPLRLTTLNVAEASICRFSAEDSATTCCFLVHTVRQCPPLMMTPADTELRVALSPPQSASEYAYSPPLCCQ